MIFDEQGLPRDRGATDCMDSCRLAGMMALIGHPSAPDMTKYLRYDIPEGLQGVRHPTEYPANNYKNFTLDQLKLLAAGLHRQWKNAECAALLRGLIDRGYRGQNTEADIPGSLKKFPDGADIPTPDVVNHLTLCAGFKTDFRLKIWLVAAILFNAIFTPIREPNQLLAEVDIAGPKWVKFYRITNIFWKYAVRRYWNGWRNEPALSEMIIDYFQNR
jgi:hypothetical protein